MRRWLTIALLLFWTGHVISLAAVRPLAAQPVSTPSYSAAGPPPNVSLVPWCPAGQVGFLEVWMWPFWPTYPGDPRPPVSPDGKQYVGGEVTYLFLSRVQGSLAQADLICMMLPSGMRGQVIQK